MHVAESELPRIRIPRIPVNKTYALVLLRTELAPELAGSHCLESGQRAQQPREDGEGD